MHEKLSTIVLFDREDSVRLAVKERGLSELVGTCLVIFIRGVVLYVFVLGIVGVRILIRFSVVF